MNNKTFDEAISEIENDEDHLLDKDYKEPETLEFCIKSCPDWLQRAIELIDYEPPSVDYIDLLTDILLNIHNELLDGIINNEERTKDLISTRSIVVRKFKELILRRHSWDSSDRYALFVLKLSDEDFTDEITYNK